MALIALAVTLPSSRVKADPIPVGEIASAFWWVVDEPTTELALALTETVSSPENQFALREWILLQLWAHGGDPWKYEPSWEAPVGP